MPEEKNEKPKIDLSKIPTLEQVRKELVRRKMFGEITIDEHSRGKKVIKIPEYGEIKIICHDGKVKTVETTIKEKM